VLRLYDTASRSVRDFVPLTPGRVGIYLCGATVQAPPHLGHLRSSVDFDVLRRWLEHTGHAVTFVRNTTDIDDKILVRAAEAGVEWWAWAYENERAFDEGYDLLGCLPATVAPRATGHVPEMVALIERLVETGHAYAAGGDVYFDVRSFPAYGALSGQRPEHMLAAEDGQAADKRDPRDFALWKAHKPGEPDTASWRTPWGDGRPGWHLECSAMARRYLGPEFDIHGGGLDLVFPHHENEVAQSVAAGDGFARWWLHNGWVTMAGEKMSKSLGNTVRVAALAERWRPVELRYYLVAPHYRSHVEYSEASLDEAAAAYRRIEGFVQRATERVGARGAAAGGPTAGGADAPGVLCADFVAAMDDDLAVPRALAAVHEVVREGNVALAEGDDTAAAGALRSVRAMTAVLGLDPLDPHWTGARAGAGVSAELHGVLDALVKVALEQRQSARERKDFAAADAVRDQLKGAGVLVEDTPQGPRWTLADGSTPGAPTVAGER